MLEEITLENIRPTLYKARIENQLLLEKGRFYLAVRAENPVEKIIEYIPRITKISSFDVIDIVIGSALPGVLVQHIKTLPPELTGFYNFEIFFLKTDGCPYWNGIKNSKLIAVRIPDELRNLEAGLFVLI
jgi:type VI secretion system protein ImpJ